MGQTFTGDRFVLKHFFRKFTLKMKADLHTNEVGVLIYFDIKNAVLVGHWLRHLQSLSQLISALILQ